MDLMYCDQSNNTHYFAAPSAALFNFYYFLPFSNGYLFLILSSMMLPVPYRDDIGVHLELNTSSHSSQYFDQL